MRDFHFGCEFLVICCSLSEERLKVISKLEVLVDTMILWRINIKDLFKYIHPILEGVHCDLTLG